MYHNMFSTWHYLINAYITNTVESPQQMSFIITKHNFVGKLKKAEKNIISNFQNYLIVAPECPSLGNKSTLQTDGVLLRDIYPQNALQIKPKHVKGISCVIGH